MSESTQKYDLSVVIVNYNVVFFLEQCLNSVFAASKNLNVQIFVVDNNSVDGSINMLKENFSSIVLIENKENVGFSKANNQAIKSANSPYVLLLNPDTVIEEDTFDKCIDFMNSNTNCGGLGIRMLDGKGNFLPESKRGFPSPSVAFYKIFGLSYLFPKSQKFGRYHLGFLSEFEVNEVDVLSGAFMLLRTETLEKIGLLDEQFFMYGEDIDLSYRIKLGGYKNYYFPETKIIHYKGESTKKSSVNYVFVFYKAMILFAKKHFSNKNANLFSFAINLAIYMRASLSLINRFVKKIATPFLNAALTYSALFFLADYWRNAAIQFPEYVFYISIPLYIFVFILFAWLIGVYDKGIRNHIIWKATIFASIFILVIYALLPKDWQFSRLFILTASLVFVLQHYLVLIIQNLLKTNKIGLPSTPKKHFAIIGDQAEFIRVKKLLELTYPTIENIIGVYIDKNYEESSGSNLQLNEIIQVHKINEIIYCAKDVSAKDIIEGMTKIESQDIEFKIAQPNTSYLIGSNSIDNSGDFYALNFSALSKPENIRSKRLFDFLFSIILLLLSPILLVIIKFKVKFISNLFRILSGKKSFVGYLNQSDGTKTNLPKIKPGILEPFSVSEELTIDKKEELNLLYAKEYSFIFDFEVLVRKWKLLGE
jgi:GT2 family glycosyltransferase